MLPLRPRPPDFRPKFISVGWGGIQAHYGANSRTIRRWIDEEGREDLIAHRAAYVARLRDRDRAFRRRVAALGTNAGLPAEPVSRPRQDHLSERIGA